MIYLSTAHLKADDTYIQLKKDLEYLDLKVGPNKVNATSSFSSSSPCPLCGLQSCSPAANICLPLSSLSCPVLCSLFVMLLLLSPHDAINMSVVCLCITETVHLQDKNQVFFASVVCLNAQTKRKNMMLLLSRWTLRCWCKPPPHPNKCCCSAHPDGNWSFLSAWPLTVQVLQTPILISNSSC